MVTEYRVLNGCEYKPYLEEYRQIDCKSQVENLNEFVAEINKGLKLDCLSNETNYVVSVNTDFVILGILQASIGNVYECFNNRRTIGQFLLLSGAEEFIVIHNHTNGRKEPSENDRTSAEVMETFGNCFDIKLVAAICIGKNGWSNYL